MKQELGLLSSEILERPYIEPTPPLQTRVLSSSMWTAPARAISLEWPESTLHPSSRVNSQI